MGLSGMQPYETFPGVSVVASLLTRGVCRGRFAYKDEYEKFKLYLTIILLLGAVACRFVLHYR